MGYIPKRAGLTFFVTTSSNIRLWDADELVSKGRTMIKRMCVPDVSEAVMYNMVLWWVYNLIPKKGHAFVDERQVTSL